MREIKFRAWEKTGINLSGNEAGQMLMPDDYGRQIKLPGGDYDDKNVIWMLFTGVKDKNGVDIYEGDIAIHRKCGDFEGNNLITGEVVIEPSRGIVIGNWPMCFDVEVIGNIHQNPELLKS